MARFFCPGCWRDYPEDVSPCPGCGLDIHAFWNGKDWVSKLIVALHHPDAETRIRAGTILGRRAEPRAVQPLIDLFRCTRDPYVAQAAVQALGQIGTPQARQFLETLRDDPSVIIGAAVRQALAAPPPPPQTPRPTPAVTPTPPQPVLPPTVPGLSLADFLPQASQQVAALGADFEADRARLEALRQRLSEQRCYLAVVGQFKRGKSTLVNALLGEDALPSSVIPLTSIPTFVREGENLSARVLFDDSKQEQRLSAANPHELAQFLARFVTESANPHNRLGVRLVEATHPAPILRQGLVLIDTPGIGSTFQHNTEATVNFLPQCDAAIFVVSADPPITEVEVEFLKLVRQKMARVFFILNKIDYLQPQDRRTAVSFLGQVLCEQVGFDAPPPIFCASARQGLAARQNHDPSAWRDSGLAAIEAQIVDFLLTEKSQVLSRALARQTQDVLADVQRRLDLTAHSLQMPLAELEDRSRRFEENLLEIDEQRIVLLDRVAKDEQRLHALIRRHTNELLPQTRKFLQEIVQSCQDQQGSAWSEDSTRQAIAAAIPRFFERQFGATHHLCEQQLREALLPHRQRADDLVASVHRLVASIFDVPFIPPTPQIELTRSQQPYWRTHKWTIKFGAVPVTWVDRLFPRRFRHARIRRRVMEQVEYLVTRNVGDLQYSARENLRQSVESFRESLNQSLDQSIQATRGALERVRRQHVENSASVAPELDRLQASAAALQVLRQRLASIADTQDHNPQPSQADVDHASDSSDPCDRLPHDGSRLSPQPAAANDGVTQRI